MGAQMCAMDGLGFGACVCSMPTGTGGSGATGGMRATGGSSATGGTATGGQSAAGGASTGGVIATGGSTGGSAAPDGGTADAAVVVPTGDAGGSSRLVSVRIIDAVVGPGKQDGTQWDAANAIPDSLKKAILTALVGPNPYNDVIVAFADPLLSSLDKPDPIGTAQLTAFGMTLAPNVLAKDPAPSTSKDTFTPTWPPDWQYVNIPIDTDVRITIRLEDSDLVVNDPIRPAEINSTDLKAALAAQKKWNVKVADQTSNELLFVGISVTEQLGPVKL